VALRVAEGLDCALLSMDSMKVYRGMDRGTAKPSGVRFGLTDLVEADQSFSVGAYVTAAIESVERVHGQGRLPLFVGGTGLYLRALVRGLFEMPPIDQGVRDALRQRVRAEGSPSLHEELVRKDQEAAARIHPHDAKRVVRALEVVLQTGLPISDWQRRRTVIPLRVPRFLVGIRRHDQDLRQRIEQRVEEMFRSGLVEEVASLSARGLLGPAAREAIGYREVLEFLEGSISEVECRERVIRATWRLSRRQWNWFRQFPEIRWVDAGPGEESLDTRVLATFQELMQEAA
jgi:tRNA dimethylallyltransferase